MPTFSLAGAFSQHNTTTRRIRDPGLQVVKRVCTCGIDGISDAVVAATGKLAAVVARTLFQPILMSPV